jgi:lipid A 3-O-deacylase
MMCRRRTLPLGLARSALEVVCAAALCGLSVDAAVAQSTITPSATFVQVGAWSDTRQLTAGLTWDWGKRWQLGGGQLSGYWEVSLSAWSYPSMDGRREAWLGQIGAVPTFRYRPEGGASPWFAELGVGASLMTTVYQTQRKRFSTSFNFADHVALGRSFGAAGEHELSLRAEHFSNAGIKHPNPGQNFFELRYVYRFQ